MTKGKLYTETRKILYLPIFQFVKAREAKVMRDLFNAFLDDAKEDAKWATKEPVSSMSIEAKEWYDKWFGASNVKEEIKK